MNRCKTASFVFLLLLFTCKSNKEPLWIQNPPPDDDLNIYIVGIGNQEEVYDSVLEQLYSRLGITEDYEFSKLFMFELQNENSDNVSIIDRYSSDTTDYILTRIRRSYYQELLNLFKDNYSEMVNYLDDYALLAQQYFDRGEVYNSYIFYVRSLNSLLEDYTIYNNYSIKVVISRLKEIFSYFEYQDIVTFNQLVIGKPITTEKFSFSFNSKGKNLDGFLYNLKFSEGWDFRDRVTKIPIRNNKFAFIPPIQKASGTSTISSELNIEDLLSVLKKDLSEFYISEEINSFNSYLQSKMSDLRLSFDYEIRSDLKQFSKVIYFNNNNIEEGVLRYLLELGDPAVISTIEPSSDSILEFVRNTNSNYNSFYKYMIMGNGFTQEIIPFDDSALIVKFNGSFSLIDLENATVIKIESIESEFVAQDGDANLGYLDLGLKIGSIVHDLKF